MMFNSPCTFRRVCDLYCFALQRTVTNHYMIAYAFLQLACFWNCGVGARSQLMHIQQLFSANRLLRTFGVVCNS